MKTVVCTGTAFERGLSHGHQLRELIVAGVAKWRVALLGPSADEAALQVYAEGFLGGTGLCGSARRLTPGLVEEVAGIAAGSGQSFEVIMAYNLMDELWWFALEPELAPPGCSVIGRAGVGRRRSFVAQNMDLPLHMAGQDVVLQLSGPDMPDTLLLSAAGMIGLTGMTRHLAVCVNTLLMLPYEAGGLGVAFVLRALLACRSVAEAAVLIQELPHASGQHYVLVDQRNLVGFEASGGGVVAVGGADRYLHTNHPLTEQACHPLTEALLDRSGRIANSRQRMKYLEGVPGTLHARAARTILDDSATPLCLRGDAGEGMRTFGSVLFRPGEGARAEVRGGIAGSARWSVFPM